MVDILWKDHQYTARDNYKLDYGLPPGILLLLHKYQGMDRDTSDCYKLHFADIPNSEYIRDDKWVDFQYSLARMNIQLVHLFLDIDY